jgi:hypothetical protein
LSPQQTAEESARIPAYQIDARSKGIPQLGAGAIYPVPESEILCDPFAIPDHMPQGYALDVGWKRTAALFGAHDLDSDILYLYSEHYVGQEKPPVHAAAIRARGEWLPGVIDPAARGRQQRDGEALMKDYQDLGLELFPAVNTVESGIYEVWTRMATGRLKVFRTLQNWLKEFRLYRRDEKGHIVKENDHLMDCSRYLVVSGIPRFTVRPASQWKMQGAPPVHQSDYDPYANSWKPR